MNNNNFVTRAYNSITVSDGVLCKTSSNKKLLDEINFYRNLPEKFKSHFPTFIEGKTNKDTHKLYLKYVPSTDLGKHYTTDPNTEWDNIVERLVKTIYEFRQYIYDKPADIENDNKLMLLDKTFNEYTAFSTRDQHKWLIEPDTLKINGAYYKNFKYIQDNILLKLKSIKSKPFSFIHGDFCFTNILITEDNRILLVDPRGSFGKTKYCYGDYRYDLAKLLHSIEGCYEYIIYDKYNLNVEKNIIDFQFSNAKIRKAVSKKIKNLLTPEDYNDARFIQGLIFIGMCDRHYDDIKRQCIMYSTGIKILNETLEI